jgi:hypothetical protein
MATVSALYGSGVYGSSEYGVINVTASVTGVSATALTRTLHINAFEVDITEPLYGPDALTVSTNTATVNIAEKVSGVIATFSVNAAGLSIRSINRVPVTGSPMTGSIGTLSPNVNEPIATGVIATTSLNTVQVHISEKLDSVSATGGIGSLEHSNTVTLTGVESVGQVGEVEDQPLERIATGVFATGGIGSLTLHTTAGLTSVVGTFSVGTPTVTGVTTTFTASAYDRRNVANTLPKQTSSRRRAA